MYLRSFTCPKTLSCSGGIFAPVIVKCCIWTISWVAKSMKITESSTDDISRGLP